MTVLACEALVEHSGQILFGYADAVVAEVQQHSVGKLLGAYAHHYVPTLNCVFKAVCNELSQYELQPLSVSHYTYVKSLCLD